MFHVARSVLPPHKAEPPGAPHWGSFSSSIFILCRVVHARSQLTGHDRGRSAYRPPHRRERARRRREGGWTGELYKAVVKVAKTPPGD